MRIGNALYFDHQATTPLDARVFDKLAPYFGDSFGNPHATDHAFGWRSATAIEGAACQIARLVGADAEEVIFTSGATEANNLAILGIAKHHSGESRNRILISSIEHKSVLACGRALEIDYGYEVELIPVDKHGFVDLDSLERSIGDDVLLISVMAVNSEVGVIQPVQEVARFAKRCGAVFHCDGAQAPCAVEMEQVGRFADLLSLSSHKMYGPPGVGTLIVRHEVQNRIAPIVHGGGQQHGLRSGTLPLALCVGMGAAAEIFLSADAQEERDRLRRLRDDFVARLVAIYPDAKLNGPDGVCRHPGNINIRLGCAADELLGALQPKLAASSGSACTSGIQEPSHVLRAMGLTAAEADESVRFSIGRRTTVEDIEEAVTLVVEAMGRMKESGLLRAI